jgi:Fe-Mn family superoxide dismutase
VAPDVTVNPGGIMPLTLPELPYATDALSPYLSPETFEFHYDKHHRTYVDNLNKLVDGTAHADAPLEEIIMSADGGLFNNAAQVWNHTLYWHSMTPGGGGAPTGAAADAIAASFGSYEAFKEQFKAAAVSQFGSGWAWLVIEDSTLSIMATGNADLPMKHAKTAVLTCDVWEHAYYIDYRNRRPDYVDTFLDHLINWSLLDNALG